MTGDLADGGGGAVTAMPVAAHQSVSGTAPPRMWYAALDTLPEAVLICAADHTVRFANLAARHLAADLAVGDYAADTRLAGLAQAVRTGADSFVDEHQGRRVHGRRRTLPEGYVAWHVREAVAEPPGKAAVADERAHAFLAEVGRRLSGSLNQRRCLRAVAELAVAYLADAVVVLGPAGRPHSTWVRLVAGGRAEENPVADHEVSAVPGLVDALADFPPGPSRRLDPATAPAWLWPDSIDPIGDLLLVPMPGHAVPGGALLLARNVGGPRFSDEDVALAGTFAARAGAAVSAAALYREQADAMAVLQADLLPPQLPQTDGAELVASYQPAEHGLLIGGDFYDVFPPAGAASQTVVVLGDVCGKGAPAAAMTGKVRQTLRALHLVGQHPAALLRVLNEALLQPGQSGPFVTLVVGSLTRGHQGQIRLTFATGGHPAPLVLRHNGSVEEVPASGTLIGVIPDPRFGTAAVELAPGDLCLLYSDGMTEARGGATGREQYGEHRLRQALAGCHGMPADAAVERLRQLVSDWVRGGIHDDIAMLAIRARDDGTRR